MCVSSGSGPQNTSGSYFPYRPVPMFVFSPVILQHSRNNQIFKPRALQDIAQHHASQDIQEEMEKVIPDPKKLLIKSHSWHLQKSPGEITRPVTLITPHETEMQILGLERGWKADWLKGNGLKSTFWDIWFHVPVWDLNLFLITAV